MALRVGAPAEGADFFDRMVERAQLWRTLQANHVVLSAPRRLGKTSLLKQMAAEAAGHGLLAVYLDVSSQTSAMGLVHTISKALPDKSVKAHMKAATQAVARWFSLIGRVRVDAGDLGGIELETRTQAAQTWEDAAELLQMRLSQMPVLIVLDEFSVFIDRLLKTDAAQAQQLLTQLRTWRQRSPHAWRFVFSGSIGLNRLLERHGLQTETNDCDDFNLGPFSAQDAIDMLQTLSQREGWPLAADTAAQLCDRVGWLSPFYLCTVLEESIRAAMARSRLTTGNGQALTELDVSAGLAQLLDTRSKFNHWYKRLADHFADRIQLDWAQHTLQRLCAKPDGLKQTTLLSAPQTPPQAADILLLLEEHGYIVREGQRIRFQSPLLRQYWKKNHGQ